MSFSTKVTLWVLLVLGLLILAGIVTGQPVPEKPKVRVSDSLTSQGAGAAALLSEPEAKPELPVRRSWTLPWKYAETNYTNVWFNLQQSTDGKIWQTIQRDCTGTLTVTNRGEPCRLFRLEGRFHP